MKIIRTTAIALLAALATTAHAASVAECLRDAEGTFGVKQAKRICNPKNYVQSPHEYGWVCDVSEGVKIYKRKGEGARRKRDAICE